MSADAARRAIEAFFEGFNDEDDARIHETLNFPHVRLGSTGSGQMSEGRWKRPFATQHRDIATGTIEDVPCLAEGALSRADFKVYQRVDPTSNRR